MTTTQQSSQPAAQPLIAATLEGLHDKEQLATLRPLIQSPRFIPFIERSWFEHLCERGRIPKLGDNPPPYYYRGWLLFQVWIASYHPLVVPRWPYYMRMLEAGCLTDEPIPQINFEQFPPEHSSPMKALRKLIEKLGRFHGYGERALNTLIDWLAYGLGVERERPTYISEEVNEFLYRNFDVSGFLIYPSDYLGTLLEEMRGSKKQAGFFLTPGSVSRFMAEVLMDDTVDHRAEQFLEPACGSGRNMLMASNWTLRILGIDIDEVCCKVARVNSALWAPWIAYPPPEHFFEGMEATRVVVGEEGLEARELLAEFTEEELVPQAATRESDSTPAETSERQPRRKARRAHRTDEAQGSLFDFIN